MKRYGKILIICLVVVLAGLWFWRYKSMNDYYASLSKQSICYYSMGEFVEVGDNYIGNDNGLNGYGFRVDKFEIVDGNSYCQELNYDGEHGEKLALISITLRNKGSQEGIRLTDLSLIGEDNYVGMNWDLLLLANPGLEGSTGIRLSPDTEYSLVIPYDIFQRYFSRKTYKNIEEYPFFFVAAGYPEEQRIQLSIFD